MTEFKNLPNSLRQIAGPDSLRQAAGRSFNIHCNNGLYKEIYIRAFIRGANWAKTNKY